MNQDKRYHPIVRFLLGVLGGSLSALPGFQMRDYEETFCLLREEKGKVLPFVRKRILYVVGFVLGFLLFFLVPVQMLAEGYSFAITCLLLALFLSFAIYDVYRLIRNQDRKHLVSSLLLFLVFCAVPFLFHFVKIDLSSFSDTMLLLVFFLLALFSSFFSSFAGIAVGSLFFVTATYLPLSERLFSIVRGHFDGQLLFLLALVVGLFLGWCLSLPLHRYSLKMERHASNLGFSLATMATIFAFDFHPTLEMEATSSVPASFFILLALVLGGLALGLAFTAHGYKSLSPEENPIFEEVEKKETTLEEARYALGLHYKDLLLDGLFVSAMKVDETKVYHKETIPTQKTENVGIDLDKLKAVEQEMKER